MMTARLKSRTRAARPAALAVLVLAGMLASPGDAQSQAGRTHTVVMANMRFGQMPASVRRGDVILWVNRDTVPHTATARNRSFDIRVAPRASARMVVQAGPGNVPVYCVLHPAMRTTMRVVR